jgi:hypothetical protein
VCSQSKISKTERGRTLPGPDDVAAWARVTGAESHVRDELVAIAEQAGHEATHWRRVLAPGRRRVQEDIRELEAAASVLRVFASNVVAGLAQTRPFAEAMVRLDRPPIPAKEVGELVDARLARQDALDDSSKTFHLLMGEAALRRRLIGREDMRDQLRHLLRVSRRRNVHLGLLPFGAEERVRQSHGYAILGDPEADDRSVVLVETITRGLVIRSSDEIAEYVAHFEALRSAALEGAKFRAAVEELIATT